MAMNYRKRGGGCHGWALILGLPLRLGRGARNYIFRRRSVVFTGLEIAVAGKPDAMCGYQFHE
jgi:hypothetical protein